MAPPAAPRPHIVWKPIPFGRARQDQTRAYSSRHYGISSWKLAGPHVIVEHYTAGDSALSAWRTFANDAPYLGELPGVCAQFIVDTDGTIWQLTSPTTMCRHTVGLNWTAIGIENVGTSDGQILSNPVQMRASLRLTLWLMARYGISIGNVIGHSESVWSSYYREHVASYRCVNHSDWLHADMVSYRARLARLARMDNVPLGSGYKPVNNGC